MSELRALLAKATELPDEIRNRGSVNVPVSVEAALTQHVQAMDAFCSALVGEVEKLRRYMDSAEQKAEQHDRLRRLGEG